MVSPETPPTEAFDAAITVADVLEWPGFDVTLVAGATGVDHRVRWAQATELVDPSPYLRGDEIILTVGSDLDTAAKCAAFVDALIASDAAAIGLAVDVVDHTPPAGLAALADARGLALFTVPNTLPFVAFTEKLAALHGAARERVQRRRDNGLLLDYIRRGLASPWVLRDQLGGEFAAASTFGTVCLAAGTDVAIGGLTVVGDLDSHTVVVAEHDYLQAFLDSDAAGVVGVGRMAPLDQLHHSLKESVAAFAIATSRRRSAGPRDLASLSGLLGRMSSDQFAPFRDHVLAPLEQHDARHGTQLVQTLDAFFASGGSVSATATELFLHVNSVRNRLARVETITGLDPTVFGDRVTLTLALESRGR
ncbi:PucR family transcriptional regulator [Marisediminicola sp. LYQ134]|uniref:PucR family transcriptional regulator n=1 Tax=unclassified Marisediminicola TaxID=2618316 RepID=UPI00398332AF